MILMIVLYNGKNTKFNLSLSMLNGKVYNVLSKTKSMLSCYIRKATPFLSSLHPCECCCQCCLHIGYRSKMELQNQVFYLINLTLDMGIKIQVTLQFLFVMLRKQLETISSENEMEFTTETSEIRYTVIMIPYADNLK